MSSSVTIFDNEVDDLVDSLVDQLVTTLPAGTLRGLADDRLLRATGSLERLGRAIDARRVEAAGELAHRSRRSLGSASLAVRKGCRDGIELLRRVTGAASITIRRRVHLGTETRPQTALSGDEFPARFPHIATALDHGTLGVDAAGAIITELVPSLTRADPEHVRIAEAELVASATGTGPDGTIPATADQIREQAIVWRAYLDQDGTLPTEEKAMAHRGFSPGAYNTVTGLVHGKYALMPEIYAKLGRIFDACITPKTRPTFLPTPTENSGDTTGGSDDNGAGGESADEATDGADPSTNAIPTDGVSTVPAMAGPADTRTADQQRHDILAAMIDGFARSGQTPTLGGASPTVLVTVSADDLDSGHGAGFVSLGGPGGDTVPLSLRAVTQMICTGGTQTIRLTPDGQIIELGSEQRCFTPAQRRAITVRDGGCAIPGCTCPAASTEIHHVTADTDGGPTHTDNGVLLCWFHHRTIATSGWEIRMIGGIPHVKAPPWLGGDGLWHPTSRSPTRQTQHIKHALKKDRRGDEDSQDQNGTEPPPTAQAA